MATEPLMPSDEQDLLATTHAPMAGAKRGYWWVNQGSSYARESKGGYLWAPRHNKKGRTHPYWSNMTLLREGDRVFHYKNGAIRALSLVVQPAVETDGRPDGVTDSQWEEEGWLATVRMEELDSRLPLAQTPQQVREKAGPKGPFDSTGGVKQGYLFPLEEEPGRVLEDLLTRLPRHPLEHVLPHSFGRPASTKQSGKPALTGATIYSEIASQGFCFPDWLVTDYVLALATKPLVILCGISGTGKTKLAQIVARAMAPDETTQIVLAAPPISDAGSFVHTVGLSTLKYRGLTLPVASLTLFDDLPQKGERLDLVIRLTNGQEFAGWIGNVGFTEPAGRTVFRLFWDKDLGSWLVENASEGDHLVISPQTDGGALRVLMELHKATRITAQTSSSRVAFLSVRPDWTDNRSLLGYYNPLTARYQPTELLRLLLTARADRDRPHFVILDEMNLAKVEYYFSDFLSAMEAGTEMILHDSRDDLFTDETESTVIPRRVSVPKNVFFSGTVNVDETTYMFSPKVLDRANVIEFNEVELRNYPVTDSTPGVFRLRTGVDVGDVLGAARPPSPADWSELPEFYKNRLRLVHGVLAPYHLHFGYRVANEIARYMNLAAEFVGSEGMDIAFDLQLLQKVFPKLAGNRARLERPLSELLAWCRDPDYPESTELSVGSEQPGPAVYPRSAAKLSRMLETLRTTGFVSFVE